MVRLIITICICGLMYALVMYTQAPRVYEWESYEHEHTE